MTEQEQIFAYKELRNNGQAFFVDTYEDADRIIEALEKQIPKKAVWGKTAKVRNRNTVTWVCPVCRYHVNSEYCRKCGQSIEWNGVEKLKEQKMIEYLFGWLQKDCMTETPHDILMSSLFWIFWGFICWIICKRGK